MSTYSDAGEERAGSHGNQTLHSILLFQVRSRICALKLDSLREVMRPLPVSPLPNMPDFLIGVSRIRDRAVPVADAGVLIGMPANPAYSRFLTLAVGSNLVALAVESVIGVRPFDPGALSRLPPLLRDAGRDIIAALGTLDAELLSLLELGRSLTDQMLQSVELGDAPLRLPGK